MSETTQSALTPASAAAELIHAFALAMTVGAVLVLAAVLALAVIGVFARPRAVSAARWIVGGGVAFPLVVLSALLVAGLLAGEALLRPGEPPVARVQVIAKQWWWEVRYLPPEQRAGSALAALVAALCGSTALRTASASDPAPVAIVLANELRLPVGAPVVIELTTTDVIHSFWIPALAGKVDMIPGRVNRLVLQPDRAGAFRGQCAEFCGGPARDDGVPRRRAARGRVPRLAERPGRARGRADRRGAGGGTGRLHAERLRKLPRDPRHRRARHRRPGPHAPRAAAARSPRARSTTTSARSPAGSPTRRRSSRAIACHPPRRSAARSCAQSRPISRAWIERRRRTAGPDGAAAAAERPPPPGRRARAARTSLGPAARLARRLVRQQHLCRSLVHRHRPRLPGAGGRARADHAHATRGARERPRQPRDLQPALHDARHRDDVPLCRAGRGGGRGVPAARHARPHAICRSRVSRRTRSGRTRSAASPSSARSSSASPPLAAGSCIRR